MKTTLTTILIVLLGSMAPSVQAATLTWNGATNANWSAANWTGGTPVDNGTDALFFAGSTNLSNTNNLGNYTASSITFNSGSGAFVLAGNAINLTGGVTNSSSNLQTINLGLALSAGTHTFTVTTHITVNGTISGAGGITKSGTSNTLFLTGTNNSYGGVTNINGGPVSVLKLSDGLFNSSIGASSNAASNLLLPNSTSTLTYAGSGDSTDRLFTAGSSNGTINASGTGGAAGALSFTNTGAIAYSTVDQVRGFTLGGTNVGDNTMAPVFGNNGAGVFSLAKAGAGKWILTGNNTYTGTTTISGGTLQIGNGSGTGTLGSGNVTNNAALVFNRSDAYAAANAISGAGNLTQAGPGTTTLSGNNTYTGANIITAGTLQFSKTAALYNSNTGNWTATNINVKSGATAAFNVGAASGEFSASDIDTIKALSSNATNGFNSGSFLGLDTTNAAGGSFAYTSNITNTNSSANVLGLKKLGTGTLDLSGSSTYTGATTVSAGTLLISAGNINSSAVTVAAGAQLKYNSSTARTGAITLSGNGSGSRSVLSGSGTINVAMTLDNPGDTLSPGNSPGLLTFATSESWNSFTYLWETNNFTGTTAGTNFDQIVITGGLTLGGGLGAYVLDLNSLTAGNLPGNVGSFSDVNRSWTILTTTTGITGFDAANWTISTGNFTSSPTWSGTWSLAKSGNDLVLAYAIPEPSAVALLSIGIFASGFLAIRRSRRA
jgi:fibronectin-binding autotransporter adhesin